MAWIRVVSLAGATVSLAFCAQPTAARTNHEIVELALARNRDLLAAQQRLTETQGLLRQAGVRPVPTVEVEGGTGRPLGTRGEEEYTAGYFYPVETAGKRAKRVRVAEQSVALAQADLDERRRQLAFDVKTRAIDALAEREKLATLDRLAGVNQEAYQLTVARVREGDAAPLEQQLLAVEQNRAEAQHAATRGRLEAATLELRRLVGVGAEDALPLADRLASDPREPELKSLQQVALRQRPDLRVAVLLETQGGAEIALAEAQARPDVTLSARYTRRSSRFDEQLGLSPTGARVPLVDRDDVVTLGVSIPLQTRKRNQGNIEAAAARAAGARLRREYLESSVPLEVEAAYRRWRAARTALSVLDRGVVEQSEKNVAVIRQAYQLGQLRLLDVLNEQRRLIDTELAYIDAQAELARAVSELERSIGGDLP